MSIKFSEVIPSPKSITSFSDIQKPVIALSEGKKSNNTVQSSDILLSNRNQILSQGTYIQAWRDFQNVLKPIVNKLEEICTNTAKKENDTVSFRPFIEKNVSDIKTFDESFLQLLEAVKKGNVGYQDILNIAKLFSTLDAIGKKSDDSDEATKFKKYLKDLNAEWDKILNTSDNRMKFVYHVLQGADLVEKLDSAIKKLSQSPTNQNADLALFSERVASATRNVREVGGNITAYAQSNNFNEQGLQKRAFELPEAFKEFTKTLSEVAQNTSVQNNREYVELLTNIYNDSMALMQFFLPEIKKNIDNHQEYAKDLPVRKYNDGNALEKSKDTPAVSKPETRLESKLKTIMDKAPASLKMIQTNNTQNQQSQIPIQMPIPMQAKMFDAGNLVSQQPQQVSTEQMLEFLRQKAHNPQNLTTPYSARNSVHSPTSDDKELRALQGLWDWADHSVHMKNKINAVNEIGQSMEEMAMAGSGKPNPEMVALAKRSGRLNSLKSLMSEVPKINHATQELEKATLDAQQSYMAGVNQIATQKLKLDIDGAHMQSEQHKIYHKGLEKLNLDSLEIETNMARNYTKITGLFNDILMARIDSVWDNIKRLTRQFKF